MTLFSGLFGRSGKAHRLLAEYADECFVHAAPYGKLSPQMCRENLDAFLASIDRRIARLQAFAGGLGTVLPDPDGNRGQLEWIAQSLDRFCKTQLCELTAMEPALAMDWRAQTAPVQVRQVQTLAIDLGTYCGEVGMRCASKYQWGIDEARYTPASIMATAGRVVIVHNPVVIANAIKKPVDAIDIAAFTLSQIVHFRKSKGLWRPDYFGSFMSALADGRYL